jgi:predicted nucleotidyltransferase component of viral defense system
MSWDALADFRLVGGTNLSLRLGHRKSIDIDMFSDVDFDKETLSKLFRKKYPNAEIRNIVFGLTIYLPAHDSGFLKLDIMETDKFIRNFVTIENIRFAHFEDIAAMKLEAITSRKTKKDYFDIAELLKMFTFEDLLKFYAERYPFNEVKQVLENITYFSNECESDFDPDVLNEQDWTSVKFSISDTFDDYITKKIKKI